MHDHDHHHDHGHHHHHHGHGEHAHTHGVVDPAIATTARGLWAVKWSFVGLMITALLQVVVVALSGSVALLADTIHNFGDAATAIPLGIAFLLARLRPNPRFPYGYGRAEDLAGLVVVGLILFSAIVAGQQAIERLLHPRAVAYLPAVVAASIIGFIGNEAVAVFRIRVGREINSVALIADGHHARVDGWTSLAVLFGALGVWLGYPLADPVIGLLITIAILGIVWQSARAVVSRMLDGVEPGVLDKLAHAAKHVDGVEEVVAVKARWIGHRLSAHLVVSSSADTVDVLHAQLEGVRKHVRRHVPEVSEICVEVARSGDRPQREAGKPLPAETTSAPASGDYGARQ